MAQAEKRIAEDKEREERKKEKERKVVKKKPGKNGMKLQKERRER